MNPSGRSTWCVVRRALLAVLVSGAVVPPSRLAAQSEATVDRLAPLLAAEDARDFKETLFAGALLDPDTLVARTAIRALGRIGDPRGEPLLFGVFSRPDVAGLQAEAAFALGLIRDTAAVPGLVRWLQRQDAKSPAAISEAVAAIAKCGGPSAAAFLTQVLLDPSTIPGDSSAIGRQTAVRDAWRLGRAAPVNALLSLSSDPTLLGAVVYDLGRLRAKEAGDLLLTTTRTGNGVMRQDAGRALTKTFTRDAKLEPSSVIAALKALLSDRDPGVRITAIRSLASFGDSANAHDIAPFLGDPVSNVQVTAATALGMVGGSEATAALVGVLGAHRDWAVRREALLALGRLDRVAFHTQLPAWANSADWRDRATAAEGAARGGAIELAPFLGDRDPRVVSAALQAWAGATPEPAPELVAAARADLDRPDAGLRSTSADIIARVAAGQDVPALVMAYRRARTDSIPDAAISALAALAAVAHHDDSLAVRTFVTSEPAPANYLLLGWAEANWPELADHWGPSRPIATGRSLDDYRSIARQYLVAPDSLRSPMVTIEIADRGNVPLQLFGADAPLTVANFLRLVDRHYFDGIRFHRVVPNFVVQAGDPRGDGNGGPGWAIRDEINRQHYSAWILGMALSGPDTGGSQWFITLAPQPHLDGTYTIFGKLTGGDAILSKVTQGDVIRSIHR